MLPSPPAAARGWGRAGIRTGPGGRAVSLSVGPAGQVEGLSRGRSARKRGGSGEGRLLGACRSRVSVNRAAVGARPPARAFSPAPGGRRGSVSWVGWRVGRRQGPRGYAAARRFRHAPARKTVRPAKKRAIVNGAG